MNAEISKKRTKTQIATLTTALEEEEEENNLITGNVAHFEFQVCTKTKEQLCPDDGDDDEDTVVRTRKRSKVVVDRQKRREI